MYLITSLYSSWTQVKLSSVTGVGDKIHFPMNWIYLLYEIQPASFGQRMTGTYVTLDVSPSLDQLSRLHAAHQLVFHG